MKALVCSECGSAIGYVVDSVPTGGPYSAYCRPCGNKIKREEFKDEQFSSSPSKQKKPDS